MVTSSPLREILQTYWLTRKILGLCAQRPWPTNDPQFVNRKAWVATSLFHVRFLLGMSWENMRLIFGALSAGCHQQFKLELAHFTRPVSEWADHDASRWPLVWTHLARGWLQVVKRIDYKALPPHGRPTEWPPNMVHLLGRVIRSSPPCPAVLLELRGFTPDFTGFIETHDGMYKHDVHNILQWLKNYGNIILKKQNGRKESLKLHGYGGRGIGHSDSFNSRVIPSPQVVGFKIYSISDNSNNVNYPSCGWDSEHGEVLPLPSPADALHTSTVRIAICRCNSSLYVSSVIGTRSDRNRACTAASRR
ncbi:hypothetical protein DFH06DRAFT_1135437 [Mycena polygramma]|nr:hypothetical protein DFH06DRAFT_1135437 [Mycena polygramma]